MLATVLAQEAAISGFKLGPARLDLVFILILCWSILKGGNAAMGWAFGAGLLLDLISGGPVGPFTLSLPIIAFLGAFTSGHLSYNNPFAVFPVAGLLFVLYDLLHLAVLRLLGQGLIGAESIALITLPSALLNAMAAIPACLVLSGLYLRGSRERE